MLDRILKNRVLTHILFWVVILILQSQVFLYTGYTLKVISVYTLAILPSILIAAYLLVYYQLPKYAYKKRYLKFIGSVLLSMYFLTVLARLLTVFVAEPIIGVVEDTSTINMLLLVLFSLDRLARNYLLPIYIAPTIMASIKLLKQRSEERRRLDELEKEKTTAELNFLKAQIHPHFLLNTLNNIYALTLKNSDKSSESVLKLSEMLTYVLYRCNEKYVSLKDEVRLLDNYIALEKLRYGPDLKITFDKDINDTHIQIAPLILLSIVENAFKHGISSALNEPTVNMSLKATKDILTFVVFNTKSPDSQEDLTNYTKGIGSSNIKKQLDLIYPDNYELKVEETDITYEVHLEINLITILS
ncbi:histidine kinase [Maribacter algarum]|uniref:Histidine kinase n=1 Tax=Maribacter algarum (ex Zhang et al. 2020) TaxID=2578118 RepID=A0A5S3QKF6_9FLAO|nr:histidine kinase [Maribacter algarum]TMM58314.1 histidine kinase [Maribacter algarum]